jgi:hypothetical protein
MNTQKQQRFQNSFTLMKRRHKSDTDKTQQKIIKNKNKNSQTTTHLVRASLPSP